MGSTHAQTAFSYNRCTDQYSFPKADALGSVHILCSPVAPCTVGVRFRKCPSHFTNVWGALKRKRHLRTPAVRISTASQRRKAYLSHRFCTHPGQSRSALYSNCKIWKTHKPLHQHMVSTHTQTELSYNRCTDQYSFPKADTLPQSYALYTSSEVP